ncbi:MAG: hypothetical protein Kilf2KO_08300 [Rhodospirillales bacterium]
MPPAPPAEPIRPATPEPPAAGETAAARDEAGTGPRDPANWTFEPLPEQPDLAQRDLLSEQLGDSESDRGTAAQRRLQAEPRRSDRLDLTPPQSSSVAPLIVGWVLVIAMLSATIAGAWYFRYSIVAAIPEASRLYALVGLDVPPDLANGLRVREIAFREESIEGSPTLVVTGALHNLSGSTRPIPTLIAMVLGQDGNEITQWRFRTGVLSLPPGGKRVFETRHPYPNHRGDITVEVAIQVPQR